MNSITIGGYQPRSPAKAELLREQAIALRRAGHSRREIKEILGIGSNATLIEALQGEPPPEWTRRPRAKDDLHAQARELRERGLDYEDIARELGVSKSSVSLWVRDMPRPAHLSYEESRKRSAEGAEPGQFLRTVLKTHNPRTVRKNVGADYHGCLRIEVMQGAELYRRIEGWVRAVTATEP